MHFIKLSKVKLCLSSKHTKFRKIESSRTFTAALLLVFITLAISKCYGKVRVLFFPRDNSLISRVNSHISRVRGLVVRCLLFNPEISCSNQWVCANFFYKYSEAEGSDFFRHYETFRLCETFFRNFSKVPRESSFQFFRYFAREPMLKNP